MSGLAHLKMDSDIPVAQIIFYEAELAAATTILPEDSNLIRFRNQATMDDICMST
jgi:hypothetical protein